MHFHECHSHLEHTRLHLAQGEKAKVREHLDKVKEMADEMGYHRREKNLTEIEAEL